jgi:hypothetical protein
VKELKAKQQNLNAPKAELPTKLFHHHVDIAIKYDTKTEKSKKRNSSKVKFFANKTLNNNDNKTRELSCLNCNKNKLSSHKSLLKDKLNISGINFFKNIPEIDIKKNTRINSNLVGLVNETRNVNLRKTMIETKSFISSLPLEREFPPSPNEEEPEINENEIQKRQRYKSIGFQFLNDYKNFKDKDKHKNDAMLEELKEKKKQIIINIEKEQKKCIEIHKNHIDSVVKFMKKEMHYINDVEEKSNVDDYIEQSLKLFLLEKEKIEKINEYFTDINLMIKEKKDIEQKIKKLTEEEINNNIDNEDILNDNDRQDCDISDNEIDNGKN